MNTFDLQFLVLPHDVLWCGFKTEKDINNLSDLFESIIDGIFEECMDMNSGMMQTRIVKNYNENKILFDIAYDESYAWYEERGMHKEDNDIEFAIGEPKNTNNFSIELTATNNVECPSMDEFYEIVVEKLNEYCQEHNNEVKNIHRWD